jgi:dihydroorotase
MDWSDLVRKVSLNPARILGLNKGNLGVGKDADIVIIDPDKKWVVTREGFVSKSKNSPFIGRELTGLVECTIFQGNIAYGIHS